MMLQGFFNSRIGSFTYLHGKMQYGVLALKN